MDQPSNIRDHTEKKVNATGKSDSGKWMREAFYGAKNKPRPESTSSAAQERTSDSRDRIPYRDGRYQLVKHRQLAYKKDRYGTHDLSASLRSTHLRSGSYIKRGLHARHSNPFVSDVPKGGGGEGSSGEQEITSTDLLLLANDAKNLRIKWEDLKLREDDLLGKEGSYAEESSRLIEEARKAGEERLNLIVRHEWEKLLGTNNS